MRHVNIQESTIREAIHEHNKVAVPHILGGKVNPLDLFTKEHKSDELLCSIQSFMSQRSSGRC
jgi:hypothetical protein